MNLRKYFLFLLFLVSSLSLTFFSTKITSPASAATFPSFYFYANSTKANITNGWGFTLALEVSQPFVSGSTLTIVFPDGEDGQWCRTAGSLSLVPVTSAPPDTGSINIDQGLPGAISGTCTQGVGGSSFDTLTITGVDALLPSVMYGVEVQGNTAVLGTRTTSGGSEVQIYMQNGLTLDNGLFVFTTTANHSVTVSATVLPMPECNVNNDCAYPLQICGTWQQCMACTADNQCNFGDICVSGACTEDLSCTVNTDCDYGDKTCVANNCQDCASDAHCNSGDRCRSGNCEPIPPAECSVNADCSYPNEICTELGECDPCTTDAQCGAGNTCESGVCTVIPPFQCTTNSQCNYPTEICDSAGDCNPCVTDWECSGADVCVAGACTAEFSCEDNEDCRFPDEVCTQDNQCNPCTFDEQCGEGNTCNDGACVAEPPAECTVNSQCNYPILVCGGGLCVSCNTDFACNNGDVCVDGICEPLPPDECTENAHCDYPKEVCKEGGEYDPNYCGQCEVDNECDFGDVCKNGRCKEDKPEDTLIPVSLTDTFTTIISSLFTTTTDFVSTLFSSINTGAIATTVSLVSSVGLGMGLFNIALMDTPVLFTRGIFGLLTLLGLRIKGEPYGYVYNSVSKEPLSNAMVRVFTEKVNPEDRIKLVATSVTDAFGVFSAALKPGKYTMKASKSGYRFPSQVVVTISDYPIERVYHGDPFEIMQDEEIYYSIPIDPYRQGFFKTLGAIIRERFALFAKLMQLILIIFGGALSLYLFITSPGVVNTVILLFYIPGIVFTGLTLRKDTPKYGSVVDTQGEPVPNVSLGLFDEKEQRFLTKRVTDEKGLFRFVAPDGKYHIDILEEIYEIVSEDKMYLRSSKNEDLIVIASKLVVQPKGQGGGVGAGGGDGGEGSGSSNSQADGGSAS